MLEVHNFLVFLWLNQESSDYESFKYQFERTQSAILWTLRKSIKARDGTHSIFCDFPPPHACFIAASVSFCAFIEMLSLSHVFGALQEAEVVERSNRVNALKAAEPRGMCAYLCTSPPMPDPDTPTNTPEAPSHEIDSCSVHGFNSSTDDPLPDYHSLTELLLVSLLQQLNPQLNVALPGTLDLVNHEFVVLTDDAEWVLHQWCSSYGVSENYQLLLYTRTLLLHLRVVPSWFEAVESNIRAISNQHPSRIPLTDQEAVLFEEILSVAFEWCTSAARRYHNVFSDGEPRGGLSACLALLEQCYALLSQKGRVDIVGIPFPKYLEELVKISVDGRFQAFLQSTGTALEGAATAASMAKSQATHKHRHSIAIAAVELIGESGSMFSCCEHALAMFEQVMADLEEDKVYFDAEFASCIPDFQLRRICADAFFVSVWSGAQMFLRLESIRDTSEGSPEHEKPLDPFIWALYAKMKIFVEELAEYVDLPQLSLRDWFSPFVKRWIARKESEFLLQYLPNIKALEVKNARKADDTLSSSGVNDVLSLFHVVGQAFLAMPWTLSSSVSLVQFMTSVAQQYAAWTAQAVRDSVVTLTHACQRPLAAFAIESVSHASAKRGQSVSWSESMFTCINNVECIRRRLISLVQSLNIDASVETQSIIRQASSQSARKIASNIAQAADTTAATCSKSTAAFSSEDRCVQNLLDAFGASLSALVDDSVSRIARSMSPWLIAQLRASILTKAVPLSAAATGGDGRANVSDDTSVEEELERQFQQAFMYLSALMLDPKGVSGLAAQSLLEPDSYQLLVLKICEALLCELEVLALPNPEHFAQSPSAYQYAKIESFLEMLQRFADEELGLERHWASQYSTRILRIESIIGVLTLSSSDLIRELDTLDASQNLKLLIPEAERVQLPPYLCKAHIFTALRYRAHVDSSDSAAVHFTRENMSMFGRASDWLS